ncbi:MAG TPA: hypothetical protein DCW83_01475 [Saprospirales bacterium]|jgi:hypothetical protein|nr:hypothetical protein [Saprospirales bacterium]|tara:strand:+ start:95 stop:541 length:447 start_codon:yes stop_codon:yes gene_type:complete
MYDIKQFKLSTGEEIVCEVVEWPDEEMGASDIIVRKSLLIVAHDDDMRGYRYYTLKPWLTMVDDTDGIISLNGFSIIAEANPSIKMLGYYKEAVLGNEGLEDENLTHEEVALKIKALLSGQGEDDIGEDELDELTNNVLSFPKPDKLH